MFVRLEIIRNLLIVGRDYANGGGNNMMRTNVLIFMIISMIGMPLAARGIDTKKEEEELLRRQMSKFLSLWLGLNSRFGTARRPD
jgi:hypothetical protein